MSDSEIPGPIGAPSDAPAQPGTPTHDPLPTLLLAALGVVFGDIGTSPLYMIKEAFGTTGHLPIDPETILGVLSLVFWMLIIVVSVKYVLLIMRADNRGEGGVLALGALATQGMDGSGHRRRQVLLLAIIGAALFYGDGLITPAISVLSAVEGLQLAAPALEPYVLPITVLILIGLYGMQKHGTGRVGALFGPVMCVWFATLAVLGLAHIGQNPMVLKAIDPRYAMAAFSVHGFQAFVALGAILLAVTGAEALYADMGHFGRRPIRLAWFGLVLPALVINYFGQGALLLADPAAAKNPFYLLAPSWLLYPLIVLATMATVIASQATISGTYSITRQAIQLGYLPRLRVAHTSVLTFGQIYVPQINWLQLAGVLALVFVFGSSSALAAAYGIAVTGVMIVSTLLAGLVAAQLWRWSMPVVLLVFGALLVVDVVLFSSAALKIPQGGWLPLLVAGAITFAMVTWRNGRRTLFRRLYDNRLELDVFVQRLRDKPMSRVINTAVFLTRNPKFVPLALLHNYKHNHVLHERVIVLHIHSEEIPYVEEGDRIVAERLGAGFHKITGRYGFMEQPNIPRLLTQCSEIGLHFDLMTTSFFLSRETYKPSNNSELNRWEELLFIGLSSIAVDATEFYDLPPNRVVELGSQVEI